MLSVAGCHLSIRLGSCLRNEPGERAHGHNGSMKQPIHCTFHCPDLNTQVAAMSIQEALSNTPGVMEVDVSLADQRVVVVVRDPEGEASVRRHLQAAGCPPED